MAADLKEIGASGLRQANGTIREELLTELAGAAGMKIYARMENDPVAGAIIYALTMLIRRVEWRVDPKSDDSADGDAALFVEECRGDMSSSWGDLVAEITTFLVYGWSYHEIVYKLRQGPEQKDPSKRSAYTDGKIGWRKMPRRHQVSLRRWLFDPNGGLQGMVQAPAPDFRERTIPIEKALLFRSNGAGANPEGRSILRSAYRPWAYRERMEDIEAVGTERDLAGLPVAGVPVEWLSNDASPDQKATVQTIQDIVTSIRRNETEGVVWPLGYDADKNKQFTLELLTSGGRRQFDTDKIITRYDQRIAMSVLADFLLLGHGERGSYSLGVSKAELFTTAVEALVDSIDDVFNRYAIPRLLELNGMKGRAELKHGDIDQVDLDAISNFVYRVAGVQGITMDEDLEQHFRRMAKLPAPAAAEVAKRRPGFLRGAVRRVRAVEKRSRRDEIERLAAQLAPELRRRFLEAVERIRGRVDLEGLAEALQVGDAAAAEAALDLVSIAEEMKPFVDALRNVVASAGDVAAAELGARITAEMVFDVRDPRVTAWVQTHTAELITDVTEQAKVAVRERIAEVLAEGQAPRAAAATIREHVGLSERDSRAAANLERRLRGERVPEDEIAERLATYIDQKIRDRADLIADHEALEAAGEARYASWRQAVDDGYLEAGIRRRPLVADDERQCKICEGVRDKTFGLDEEIIPGKQHVPLHLRCRCGEELVFPDEVEEDEAGEEGAGGVESEE